MSPVLLSDSTQKLGVLTGRWKGPVVHDRTCPVGKRRFWNLTGNDRMLVLVRPVTLSSVSDHYLNVLMTVEIERSAFEADDTWQASGNRTLGSCVRSI